MDLATGAMGSLLPKLVEVLGDEYKLQKSVKEGVKSLEKEMKSMHAALRKVAEVPRDQLDEQVKLWAGEVRELSFDMEDLIDKFLVRVDDDSEAANKSNKLKRLMKKMAALFTKGKARHEIADAIKEINKQVQEVASRRDRYNIDNIVAIPAATIDPRIGALFKDVTELVGIAGKRDQELMRLLSDEDCVSKGKLKVVSVVGFGGLGKTTLVKTVYEKIKVDFDCMNFVPVGRDADVKKILRDIIIDLGIRPHELTMLDERQLIAELRKWLKDKRYLIVIDDIWDGKLWTVLNWAFSNGNSLGCRIITTTRIVTVSELCCPSTNDSVYHMKPLSYDDSKRLFYKRIFSDETECPSEFEEVSIAVLKKCGGVPLAIITIASLLAQRVKSVDEWHALLESIGRGLTEDPSVEEMLRILSFSYYDLPSHLKTCLLYLSMFPEDYEIRKDRLIWMWIAESFVQFDKSKTSLFEIGETYFSELVNRNLILPIYDKKGFILTACRVHDMVLDLVTSLSREDKFVNILNGTEDSMSTQRNVRRLSLQSARQGELQTTPLKSVSLFQVRSVAAFGRGIDVMPSLSSFVVLRVLNLAGYYLGDHSDLHLGNLGSLFHLRYLGLADTRISKVPEEVGNLQFLLVLDLEGNSYVELPSTIIKLRRLMMLLIFVGKTGRGCLVPDGFGNLPSMEVLVKIHCDSISLVKELGRMERLRVLKISLGTLSLEMRKALAESLGKLSNIQTLEIECDFGEQSLYPLVEHWIPPQSIRQVTVDYVSLFSRLPTWNPLCVSQLSKLDIMVVEVRQEDLDMLGRLPALRELALWIGSWSGLLVIGADGFYCLIEFTFCAISTAGQIVFQLGAMPKVEEVDLKVSIPVRVINEEEACEGLDCSDLLGIGNLLSLRSVSVTFQRYGVTVAEARQVEASLRNALHARASACPTVSVDFYPYIPEDADDDDVCSDFEYEESEEEE